MKKIQLTLYAFLLIAVLLPFRLYAQAPAIISFSPSSGPVGTLVTITGNNLSNPTAFSIGGISAIAVSNTGSQLVGQVMPGAVTGAISVTTTGGTATGGSNFTITSSTSGGVPYLLSGPQLIGTGSSTQEQQGNSVAISADGSTAIVGAIGDNNEFGISSGAAFVYTKVAGQWIQQAKLIANSGANLGASVALSADGNTAIIGGFARATDQGVIEGAACVFTRSGTTWTLQTIIPANGAWFGSSVSLSADGNTALIGASQSNNVHNGSGNYDIGEAWVYTRTDNIWTQQAALYDPSDVTITPVTNDIPIFAGTEQGESVALSNDGSTAVVGADNLILVYTQSGGIWSAIPVKLVGPVNNKNLSESVSISGDGNTIIAGAAGESAWIFTRNGNTWNQQPNYLTVAGFPPCNGNNNFAQGSPVALSADGTTAFVGGTTATCQPTGMLAWVFKQSGGTWTQQGSYFTAPFSVSSNFMNQYMAVSGDAQNVMIGDVYDNNAEGSAWVFNAVPPPVITASPSAGTINACQGTPSASPDIQQFKIYGNQLSDNITAAAPTNFELSLNSSSGFGNTVTLLQSGGIIDTTVVYVRSAASAPSGNVSGNITLTSTGAASQTVAVAGTVNALPTVNTVSNQALVTGSRAAAIHFTGTANTFTWMNDTPAIGLAASGSGNIPAFTTVNTGSNPVTATITAIPAAASFAYLGNAYNGTVSVLNTATDSVVATVKVGSNPVGVAVSPDGKRVYVVNSNDYTVSVINTATNAVIATIPVGEAPQGISVSPDGLRVYVANYISSTVSVIRTSTNSVIATIPVKDPVGIATGFDGSRVYVTDYSDNTASVINTATNTVIATIFVGGSPTWIAVSPIGDRVYVENTYSNTVSVINTATNSVIATIAVGSNNRGISVSPDGSRIYAANANSNTVSVIDAATDSVITSIAVPGPVGTSLNQDGSLLYTANFNPGNFSVINTATNTIISTISVSTYAISLGNFIKSGTGCNGSPVSFTITVNPSGNADLANLRVSNGVLSPAFAASTVTYSASVSNSVTSIKLTARSANGNATIKVNGTVVSSGIASPIPLNFGPNTITTVVTAQDGTTTKTYTLTVTRAPSNNDNLSSIKLNPAAGLTLVAGADFKDYTASVSNAVISIQVTPTTVVPTSTITVNGIAVISGTASGAIPLNVGPNTITTVVTAQDGISTHTYVITVTRAAAPLNTVYAPISVSNPTGHPQMMGEEIMVHQGLSPNGDGINDFLLIDGINNYPDNQLQIMNRSGQLVFEAKGYDNRTHVFDGHSNKNGAMQLPGTYFYSLDYVVNGITNHKTGFIVLKY